jgi:hypothetical protein
MPRMARESGPSGEAHLRTSVPPKREFGTFREFYPYYLGEHENVACRRLHFVGSTLVLVVVALVATMLVSPWWLLAIPVIGYGFAWVGHFFFEHNKPATFSHPFYSLAGDWVMYTQILTGRIRW